MTKPAITRSTRMNMEGLRFNAGVNDKRIINAYNVRFD